MEIAQEDSVEVRQENWYKSALLQGENGAKKTVVKWKNCRMVQEGKQWKKIENFIKENAFLT